MSAATNHRATVACASVAVFLVALEMTVLAVALPALAATFEGASPSELGWVFTVYNVGVASTLLLGGWLAERHGRRRIFSTGLALFAAGSALCGAADSLLALWVGRGVQSLGGALAIPASLALVLASAPRGRQDAAVATWGAMAGIAAAVGPTLGTVVVAGLGWRWIFWLNLPIAAAAMLACGRVVTESRGDARGIDLRGASYGALAIGSAIAAISIEGLLLHQRAWVIAVAVCAACAFGSRLNAHPTPVFDPDIARRRSFAAASTVLVPFVAAFSGWLVLAPSFLHDVWGLSVFDAGLAVAPAPLLMALSAKPAARLAERVGARWMLVAAAALGVAACAWWRFALGVQADVAAGFLPGALLLGIAVGIGFPLTTAVSLRDVRAGERAMGAAGNTTLRQFSIALGIALAIATAEAAGGGLAGQRASGLACGLLFAVSGLAAWSFLPQDAPRRSKARPGLEEHAHG